MSVLAGTLLMAFAFWFVIFSPWTKGYIGFWQAMSTSCAILAATALILQRHNLPAIFKIDLKNMGLVNISLQKHLVKPSFRIVSILLIGAVSAVVLYGVFWVSHLLSSMILPFTQSRVSDVYLSRTQADLYVISILLLFVIAPAEEIFWRGLIQDRLQKRFGLVIGVLLASVIYAAVHIWSFNFMIIAAAFVCGIFWGSIYACFDSVWPCIISHALWDVMIFVLFPIK